VLRSLLFVPGNRPDMLEKATGFMADTIVPDMEDSVPFEQKEKAREIIALNIPSLAANGRTILPRINSLPTGLLEEDLYAVIGPSILGVTVGKIHTTQDIEEIDSIILAMESRVGLTPGHTKIIPWIETARAVTEALAICKASKRIIGVALGGEDLSVDMGFTRTTEGSELTYARSAVAFAATAAGVQAYDTPYVSFRDSEGLLREANQVKQLGFKGKFAIHPAQIEILNSVFRPSPSEIDYARRVIEVYADARALGRGATSLDGRMIDAPVVERAKATIKLAESIEKLPNSS